MGQKAKDSVVEEGANSEVQEFGDVFVWDYGVADRDMISNESGINVLVM